MENSKYPKGMHPLSRIWYFRQRNSIGIKVEAMITGYCKGERFAYIQYRDRDGIKNGRVPVAALEPRERIAVAENVGLMGQGMVK